MRRDVGATLVIAAPSCGRNGTLRSPWFIILNTIAHEVSCLEKTSQRTILFLIADTGAGHRSAANAIRIAITLISQKEQEEWHARQQQSTESGAHAGEQLKTELSPVPPTYRIEIVDVFEEYSRFPLREAVKLYGPAIRYNPKMYGRVFHLSNERARWRSRPMYEILGC